MKILYVEDDSRDADLTRRELRQAVPQVELEAVGTLDEALARLAPPDYSHYDLLLTDIRLPDGDGLSLLAHVRQQNLPLAVVVITGSSDEETALAALKAGADDYLIKRSDYLARLPVTLENALQSYRAQAARRARPLRVLYAEDNATDIDLTRRYLSRYAPYIQLDVVNTAAEVFRHLLGPDPSRDHDLLLLDFQLPGLNALEVLKELRQVHGLTLPIVLVTGRGGEEVVLQAIKLGAADYIVKSTDYLYKLPLILENVFQRTQLDREQAALRDSEARYRAVSELISDYAYAWRVEPDGALTAVWVTDAFRRITGFTPEEIQARGGWQSLVHPDDQPIAQQRTATLFAGKPDVSDFRIVTQAGETRWLRDYGVPIWDAAQQRIVYIYGAARDITERRERERQLEAIAIVASALRAAPTRAEMLPVILDQTCRLLNAEGAVLAVPDLTSAETQIALGHGAWARWTGVRLPAGAGVVGQVMTTGQPYLTDNLPDDPDLAPPDLNGDLNAVACVPLIAKDQIIGALSIGRKGAGVLQAYRVITEGDLRLLTTIGDIAANALHRAEVVATLERRVAQRTRELADANERLTELDRLKSKFVSDVSHELRTPVANLKLHLQLLEHGKPEKHTHYMTVLKQQVDRLTRLIEDILDLSRLELGRHKIAFAAMDLNDLVDQVISVHQLRADAAGLQLAFEPDAALPPVWGEVNQLAQVVVNLVANALNYTLHGWVRVRTGQAHARACLQIEDTGMGIDPEDMPHLFERFYRGRRVVESDIPGTGLGLAIVKEIVDLHNGQIEVNSRVGEGSTFQVWLPLAEQ